MSCERYRNALTDAAAGEPASAVLEAHLAACGACRAELARLRELLAAADESLSALVAAEPSPSLRARIREAAAASSPAPALGWRFAWPAAAAAVLALAALVAWRTAAGRSPAASRAPVVAQAPRDTAAGRADVPVLPAPSAVHPTPERAGSAGPASRESAPFASADVPAPRAAAARSTTTSRAAQARSPRREPRMAAEVLVPPGEQEALLRFVALVHRDGIDAPALAAAGAPSADLAEPAPIDIRPLEIVPLDVARNSGT